MYWNQFKNLPNIKNLSPQEQTKKYNAYIFENASAAAGAGAGAGAGGRFRELMYTDNTGKNDFYIAGLIGTSKLIYYTDTFREYDLQPHFNEFGISISDVNEIVRMGNDLYITGNFGQPNAFVGKLGECSLRTNQFHFNKVSGVIVADKINNIHGLAYYKGYLYLSNRPSGTVTVVTVCRIDCNNLNNIITANYPNTTNYQGQCNDIVLYKDNVYTFVSRGTAGSATLIKTSLDLMTYSVVLSTGTSGVNERVRTSATFLIYNDEVYIPTIRNTATGFDKMGLQVYGMTGSLKRSIVAVTISSGNPGLTPLAHWMTMYKGKLIVSNAIMGTTLSHKSLVRIDPITLNIEESIPMTTLVTDDNSILSDDYIYLNGETQPTSFVNTTPQLIKVKYNNFADYSVLVQPLGVNGSYGSISPDLSV